MEGSAVLLTLVLSLLVPIDSNQMYARTRCTSPAHHDKSHGTNLTGSRATPSLQFLSIYSRHGSRSPLQNMPFFPYPLSDDEVWPLGDSQLTKIGRLQMYELGRKIRSSYDGFLSQMYCREEMIAYSTLTDRTLMSAELFLAGLYPPHGDQLWDEQTPWQPIPVFPDYWDRVQIITQPELCPRHLKDLQQCLAIFDEEYKANITSIMKYVGNFTGLSVENETVAFMRASMYDLWESLQIAEREELPLPDWTKTIFHKPLDNLMERLFLACSTGTDKMIRLLQGLAFKEMIMSMEAKINGKMGSQMKLLYHSGHDYSLLGLQAVLGVLKEKSAHLFVKTGSALIFELHRHLPTDRHYIEVLYIDGGSKDLEPSVINIPGCDHPCDFNLLMNITAKYYNITDWGRECQI